MRKSRSVLTLIVLLVFGFSLAVPAEDVPETAYDESETLLYLGVSPFSIVVPSSASPKTTQRLLSSLHLKTGVTSPLDVALVHDTDASLSGVEGVSLALLCTLRC